MNVNYMTHEFEDDHPRWEPTVEDEALYRAGRRQLAASYGDHIGPVEYQVLREIGELV